MSAVPALQDITAYPAGDVDKLLELLDDAADGDLQHRGEVELCEGIKVPGWFLTAGGYWVGIAPELACNFGEHCDGKLMHVITERLSSKAAFRMNMVWTPEGGRQWRVRIKLQRYNPWAEGVSDHPGVAALIAYLRAWGVVA